MNRIQGLDPLPMIVTKSHSPLFLRWFCFILALSMLIAFAVTGVTIFRAMQSGEAVYRSSWRAASGEEITRESHPEKFRELQTRWVLSMGFQCSLGLLGYRFFCKLGE